MSTPIDDGEWKYSPFHETLSRLENGVRVWYETRLGNQTQERNKMSTDTPRTDAVAEYTGSNIDQVAMMANHARSLERELAAKDAEIARLDNLRVSAKNYAADFRKERDQLRANLNDAEDQLAARKATP